MNKKGFSLVEILVASFLLILGFSTFFSLLKLSGTTLQATKKFHQAVNQATSQFEELKAKSFAELTSFSFAEGRGQVTVSPVFSDLKSILLELNWETKKPSLKLWTLRRKD